MSIDAGAINPNRTMVSDVGEGERPTYQENSCRVDRRRMTFRRLGDCWA